MTAMSVRLSVSRGRNFRSMPRSLDKTAFLLHTATVRMGRSALTRFWSVLNLSAKQTSKIRRTNHSHTSISIKKKLTKKRTSK